MKTLKLFALAVFFAVSTAYAQRSGFVPDTTLQLSEEVTLHLKATVFNSDEHEIEQLGEEKGTGIVRIGGCPVMGADGMMPETILKRATLEIDGQRVSLDTSCMFNPWFAQPSGDLFSIVERGHDFRLRGWFSDGAGSYVAEWLVIPDASVRTILTNDEAIMFEYFDR